mmetsp:Transcript_85025/g.148867  ORF Transcript_85025/g.148867 Transcript_85025/m.148867 type:complete len:99 (+) Transcript_85025:471-767(+)
MANYAPSPSGTGSDPPCFWRWVGGSYTAAQTPKKPSEPALGHPSCLGFADRTGPAADPLIREGHCPSQVHGALTFRPDLAKPSTEPNVQCRFPPAVHR